MTDERASRKVPPRPPPGLRSAVTVLLAVATAGILLTLWTWSISDSVERVRAEQARAAAFGDSLRSRLLERRLREIEKRMDRIERSLSFASRSARVSEVMALRRWARRLDAELSQHGLRIARNERHVDSLRTAEAAVESVPGN